MNKLLKIILGVLTLLLFINILYVINNDIKYEKTLTENQRINKQIFYKFNKPFSGKELENLIYKTVKDSMSSIIGTDTLYASVDKWEVTNIYASQDTQKNILTACFELNKPHYQSNTVETFFVFMRFNGYFVDIIDWSYSDEFVKSSEYLFQTVKTFPNREIEQVEEN